MLRCSHENPIDYRWIPRRPQHTWRVDHGQEELGLPSWELGPSWWGAGRIEGFGFCYPPHPAPAQLWVYGILHQCGIVT